MKNLVFVVLFVMLFPVVSLAGEPFSRGTWELGVTADSTAGLAPVFGLFVADGLELTALYSHTSMDLSGGMSFPASLTSEAISADLRYHFLREHRVVPFVGAGWLKLRQDEADPSVSTPIKQEISGYTLTLGARLMLAPDRSLNLAVSRFDGDLDGGSPGIPMSENVEGTDYSLSYSLFF